MCKKEEALLALQRGLSESMKHFPNTDQEYFLNRYEEEANRIEEEYSKNGGANASSPSSFFLLKMRLSYLININDFLLSKSST